MSAQVAGEFFSRGGSGIAVFVLVLPKDGGSVLREDVLKEALEVIECFFSSKSSFFFSFVRPH